jgi:glucosamine kinase
MSFMNSPHFRTRGDDLPERLPWPFTEAPPGRLLGIDVGGDATKVVLVADGQVTRRFTAPPMNALLSADLTDQLTALIDSSDATAAGLGLPGMRSLDDAAVLGAELTRRTGRPVRVTGDGKTAWLGAFGGEPGIAVFAGTGSGAMGSDGERWARAGGHGFLLGDEGSAYWIGRAAVNAALRFEDGMGVEDGIGFEYQAGGGADLRDAAGGGAALHHTAGGGAALRDAIVEAYGRDLAALVKDVHSHPAERGKLTVLAPVVTALAGKDETARRIALQAAGHLAELASAVGRRLGPLPVCGIGGVFRAPVVWERFAELTGAVRPLAPPELGAALLAGGARV